MVAAVPGSKNVEALVMVTQDFITHGLREYSPAKHGHSPSVSKEMLLNKKELSLLMVLAR